MDDDNIQPAGADTAASPPEDGYSPPSPPKQSAAPETSTPQRAPGTDNGASTGKISLGMRAPTDPIPEREWYTYLILPRLLAFEYSNVLAQRNQCIRSQEGRVAISLEANIGLSNADQEGGVIDMGAGVPRNLAHERAGFPYPKAFRKVMDVTTRAVGSEIEQVVRHGSHRMTVTKIWDFGFENRLFGLKRRSAVDWDGSIRPIYVVAGIFQRGHTNPRERVVFVHKPEHLFRKLRWAVFRLRGLAGTFLSLKHVKQFKLYKVRAVSFGVGDQVVNYPQCDAERGVHEAVELDKDGLADLQLLVNAYKQWYTSTSTNYAWADWIHCVLNNSSQSPQEGVYSLELVLDWSVTRISVVVILPVLLSLGIGIWLNSSDWTDLATIQTAWGTASYIVTAGGRKCSELVCAN